MFHAGSLRSDLSSLRRRMLRRPGDFLFPAATLALVVGVGASVFAVVDAVLLRRLPFPDEDRLVRVFTMPPGVHESRSRNPLASVDFVRFRERAAALDRLEVIWQRERSLVGAGDPVIIKCGSVSAGFFDLLGGRPVLGRVFTPAEEEADAGLAVLGYGLWQRLFGGEASVLGRKVSIDGLPHVVIGVMAPDFQPAYRDSELWTPLGVNAHNMPQPNATYLAAVGRLAAHRSLEDARRELEGLMSDLGREQASRRGWTSGVLSLRDYQFGDRRDPLLVVLAMAGLLILLAVTNVTSFTLARTIARREDFSLRARIGARPSDALRLIVLEMLVTCGLAVAGGLVVAAAGLPLLLSLDPEMARAIGLPTLDGRARGVACLVAGLLAVVSSTPPALSAWRAAASHGQGEGPRVTRSRRSSRLQAILVGVQTTIAVTVLVAGSGLIETFWRLSRAHPGFDARDVVTAQVRLSSRYGSHEQRIAFMDTLLERIRKIPGVEAASSVSSPFIPGFTYGTGFEVENRPAPDGQMHRTNFRRVAPGYFATLRIPVQEGRDFLWSDGRTSPWVAVVSRSLADRVWPGENPIGQRIRRSEPGTGWMTVIGIVGDVQDVALTEGPDPTLYVSQDQHLPTVLPIALVVRTRGDMAAAARQIRASLAALDGEQAVDRFLPMTLYLEQSLSSDRFRSSLVAVFAGTGLTLVLLGLAGTTARAVTERKWEIAIRMALGATPSRLWRSTTCDALLSVLLGVGAGVIVSTAVFQGMDALLVGVPEPSVVLWGADAAAVAILCTVAAAIPARRVVHVHPSAVLRTL
jgi:predicted permease